MQTQTTFQTHLKKSATSHQGNTEILLINRVKRTNTISHLKTLIQLLMRNSVAVGAFCVPYAT